ncbi:MAG: hypothetical protein HY332_11200 [Chloroflexi bacterium]|nr:hypothetical protein [Chloroflexota bacterium]
MITAANQQREEELITQYVDPDPHGRGPAEARLRDYGTSVWALVAYYLDAVDHDLDRVARDYDVPREAVEAALAYYRRNQALIDARLLLNAWA